MAFQLALDLSPRPRPTAAPPAPMSTPAKDIELGEPAEQDAKARRGRAMEAVAFGPRLITLHRIEPRRNVARFHTVIVEHDLFGVPVPVRHWGDRDHRPGPD